MGIEGLSEAVGDESVESEPVEREDSRAKYERRAKEKAEARRRRSEILGHEVVVETTPDEARRARSEKLGHEIFEGNLEEMPEETPEETPEGAASKEEG